MEKYRNKIFIILPLFEGRIYGTDLYIPKDTAYEEYSHYLNMRIIEFAGLDFQPFIEITQYLKGLNSMGKDVRHAEVKSTVFHCLGLLGGR